MIPLGKQTPSIIFPVGAVIEDPMMIAEITHQYLKTRTGHMYKVKVLQWKIDLPPHVKAHLEKPDEIYITVFGENLDKIKRLS